jgi:PAS domain S-box-containing protein
VTSRPASRDRELDCRNPELPGSELLTRNLQPATRRLVVVAEGDEGLNRVICRRLERHGLTTFGVHSGADVIAAVQQHPDCLLLLDYVPPEMDGRHLLDELSNMGLRVPFVVMTGHGDERVAVEMMKLGARDYIVKQGDFIDLLVPVIEPVLAQVATEERQAASEKALHESEEKYRTLVNRVNDGIIIVQDGILRLVNQRMAELAGCTVERLIGTRFTDHVHPGEVPRLTERNRRRMAGEDVPNIYETVLRRADGSPVTIELNAGMVTSEGRPADLIVVRDITERKQAKAALRVEKVRTHEYLDIAGVMLVVLDAGGRITIVNRHGCRILGYNEGELIGQSWVGTCIPVRLRGEVRGVLGSLITGAGKPVENYEHPVVTRSGEERLIAWHQVVLRDEYGIKVGVLSSGEDITERKRTGEEKERLAREVERRKAELEQLIYAASHDLRTPLVSVQGFVGELRLSLKELLAELDRPDLPPEFRERVAELTGSALSESLRFIDAGTARMSALLAGLLRLSRLGRAAFQVEPLDMNRVVGEALRSLEYAAREAGARVEVADLPACLGDPMQVGQVFSNLVENAFKYRSPDRGLLIRITGQREDGKAVYCVEDNGIGIAPDQQERVFVPFVRVDAGVPGGEGLGLTIVTRIVERLGGRVWVESKPEKGSKFYVDLPTKA